jgi:hypothetical protein
MNADRYNQGFGLLELLLIIAIIALLVAVMTPNLIGARARAVDAGGRVPSSSTSRARWVAPSLGRHGRVHAPAIVASIAREEHV